MILIWKTIGETPLEAMTTLRTNRPELLKESLSYAGRLDPMAEGLLLIMVGAENNEREKYLGADKEYEVEILFGASTDTYDILGKVQETPLDVQKLEPENVKNILASFVGEIKQPYPPYSSKTVNGKPLWAWARAGKLSEIEIPTNLCIISQAEILDFYEKDADMLEKEIIGNIEKIKGDFRQEEIKTGWRRFFKNLSAPHLQILKIKVSCSSGTYMRTLANDLGKALGASALALKITRTKIGEYAIGDTTK